MSSSLTFRLSGVLLLAGAVLIKPAYAAQLDRLRYETRTTIGTMDSILRVLAPQLGEV